MRLQAGTRELGSVAKTFNHIERHKPYDRTRIAATDSQS